MGNNAWKSGIVIAAFLSIAIFMVGTVSASPKSLYLIADHHTRAFDAWNIWPNGTVTYQATYTLTYADDPGGIAIDWDSNTLFITAEFDYGVELVDATNMTSLGYAWGAYGLAGIDVDDANDIVYTVDRDTNDLYAYQWDPVNKTLTPISGFNPYNLPNCSGAFGLALDEMHGILWVADTRSGWVRAYNVSTWTEDTSKSFKPSHKPVGIAVDRKRGYVYTVSIYGWCAAVPPGTGSWLLSKYDLATRTETTVNMGHGGADVAVDENTGLVYVTGGCDGDNLEVWNTSTSPWTEVQDTGRIGNPAGICIPQEEVVYNPLNLRKDDGVTTCVNPGDNITYTICFDNKKNRYDVHNVTLVDTLPAEESFVSASDGGIYDAVNHTVIWYIGTLSAGAPQRCVTLNVTVKSGTSPGTTIINYCTIDSDETPATTVTEQTDVCIPPTPTPTPTPSIPEFPAYSLLIAASSMIALAFIISRRKK